MSFRIIAGNLWLSLAISVLGGLMVMAVVISVDDDFQRDVAETERNRVFDWGHATAVSLETIVNARLNLARGLRAFVDINPDFTQTEFDAFAAALEQDVKGIRSLQLAPEGVIKYMTKLEQNSAALGLDLLANPCSQQPCPICHRKSCNGGSRSD